MNGLLETLSFGLLQKTGSFVLPQRDHDLIDQAVIGELPNGVKQDRCSLKLEELLGLALVAAGCGGHARTKTSRRDDDNHFHIGERSINAGSYFVQTTGQRTGSLAPG